MLSVSFKLISEDFPFEDFPYQYQKKLLIAHHYTEEKKFYADLKVEKSLEGSAYNLLHIFLLFAKQPM